MVGEWLANGWPLVGEWLANCCPMAFQWLANGWQMVGQWLANGWPMVGPWLANCFPGQYLRTCSILPLDVALHDVASAYRCCVRIAPNCTMWLLPLDAERALCDMTCIRILLCENSAKIGFSKINFPKSAFPKSFFSKLGFSKTVFLELVFPKSI